MTSSKPAGFLLTDHNPLLWAIDQCSNRNIAVEVGTYYGGWTGVLSAAYNQVITLQTMADSTLMHFYKTQQPDAGNNPNMGSYMKRVLPAQYHGNYDFNYMVDNIREMRNVTPILTASPPKFDWHWKFDICAIDISRFPDENLKQYRYWKQHANPGAIMLIGVYTLKPYDSVITLRHLMSSIETHCDFVPVDDNYIYIKF
jgi:hypothetical protein